MSSWPYLYNVHPQLHQLVGVWSHMVGCTPSPNVGRVKWATWFWSYILSTFTLAGFLSTFTWSLFLYTFTWSWSFSWFLSTITLAWFLYTFAWSWSCPHPAPGTIASEPPSSSVRFNLDPGLPLRVATLPLASPPGPGTVFPGTPARVFVHLGAASTSGRPPCVRWPPTHLDLVRG